MSGLLRPKWLPITELLVGFGPLLSSYGFVETTTPPETGVGPEGTLPERWLPLTSMPFVLKSAMPIPEKFLSNFAARHERVLFSTVLAFTSKPPTGSDGEASKNMPAQLLRIVFPAKEPPWASWRKMPHAPPEMRLPTTLASLLARSGPNMAMPASPERLMSLERILVPVDSKTSTPSRLPMRSFPAKVVFVLTSTSIPETKPLKTFFTILVRELNSTTMPSSSGSGLPLRITWFFATVVLTLQAAPIPRVTLPMTRFPTTVVLRALVTSIPTRSE